MKEREVFLGKKYSYMGVGPCSCDDDALAVMREGEPDGREGDSSDEALSKLVLRESYKTGPN